MEEQLAEQVTQDQCQRVQYARWMSYAALAIATDLVRESVLMPEMVLLMMCRTASEFEIHSLKSQKLQQQTLGPCAETSLMAMLLWQGTLMQLT